MKAVILAAGQGMRLRPHTDDKPKCMVELAGKSLLYRQLEALRSVGVERIMLVGGYKADRLDANGVELAINPRYAETNMVSTLFCAEGWMTPGEDLLITYGDIVYEPRVVENLINFDAPIAISIDRQWQKLWESRMDDPLSDAETLKLADGNRIVELGKKPNSLDDIHGQYMGLIKVRGDSVQEFCDAWHRLDRSGIYDGKDFDNMYMTSFIQSLIDTGHDVRAAFTDNGWIEVDTVEDLSHYEQMQREGTLQNFVRLS
jgi:choline kinase